MFPTHSGEANVWVCGPARTLGAPGSGADRDENFHALLRHTSPSLANRVQAGQQMAPVRGFDRMPNQLRQPVGPGWALVGDASYFRDAVTGHGISDAFRDAEFLARALDGVLLGETDEVAALGTYQAERDRNVADLFDLACRLASYPPLDEFIELQKRLSTAIENEAQMLAALPAVPADAAVRAA